jgi:HicB family
MELSEYVGELRRELATITRFASDDITRAAEMLTEALDSSVRLTLLDVLSAAAAEITTALEDTIIDVRLSAGEPEFVVSAHGPAAAEAAGAGFTDGDDAGSARITLRLSESLKSRIEEEAQAAGMSVNSWLVRAAAGALDGWPGGWPGMPGMPRMPRMPKPPKPPKPPRIGKRLSGYARS